MYIYLTHKDTNVVLTGTELLMVMEKGMQKYHVSVNMPSMTKLVWSERGKVIGSQDLKDIHSFFFSLYFLYLVFTSFFFLPSASLFFLTAHICNRR